MEQTKKTRQEIEELFKSGVISKEEYDNLSEETRDHEQSHDKGIMQYFIPEIALLAIFVIPFALIFGITSSRYQQEEPQEEYSDSCSISSATSKEIYQTNDYFADEKGGPLLIDLGTFTDLQKFSEGAQHTFKDGIPIRVAVSKDLNRITLVDIWRKWRTTTPEETYGYRGVGKERETISFTHYGRVIYGEGAKWIAPGTLLSDKKKYIPYQPICYLNNVRYDVIPSAKKAANQLLSFLRKTGKLTWDEKTKQVLKVNGQPLTKQEYKTAKRFKLITAEKVLLFFEQDNGVHPIYKNM